MSWYKDIEKNLELRRAFAKGLKNLPDSKSHRGVVLNVNDVSLEIIERLSDYLVRAPVVDPDKVMAWMGALGIYDVKINKTGDGKFNISFIPLPVSKAEVN